MSGQYANKFNIQISDVARIIFFDEQVPQGEGVPGTSSTAADVVMTHANLRSLYDLVGRAIADMDKGVGSPTKPTSH
jgi:hypothetical protein